MENVVQVDPLKILQEQDGSKELPSELVQLLQNYKGVRQEAEISEEDHPTDNFEDILESAPEL